MVIDIEREKLFTKVRSSSSKARRIPLEKRPTRSPRSRFLNEKNSRHDGVNGEKMSTVMRSNAVYISIGKCNRLHVTQARNRCVV